MSWRVQRTLRGTSAAFVATLVALGMHTLAGGDTPNIFLVGAVALVATSISIPLAGRNLSATRLAAAVTLSQLLFHGVFATLGSATMTAAGMTPATAHIHDAAQNMSAVLAAHANVMPMAHGMQLSPDMLIAHAIAAALTIAALYRGEAAVHALLAPLVGRIMRIAWHVDSPVFRPVAFPFRALSLYASELHLTARRRGPPRLVVTPAFI